MDILEEFKSQCCWQLVALDFSCNGSKVATCRGGILLTLKMLILYPEASRSSQIGDNSDSWVKEGRARSIVRWHCRTE